MLPRERLRLLVRGAVQGVGFRPFVHRLARELALPGFVQNSTAGVLLELEGEHARLQLFLARLQKEKPPRAILQSVEASFLEAVGYANFEIRASAAEGAKTALILPDLATCRDCLRDILNPDDRRFQYPFTNCTHCGPRFSIIEALPYDRAHTSMKQFAMCEECAREYHDPEDRRFHAQPTACPRCGPQLALWDSLGKTVARAQEALSQAAAAIRAGEILALKGLGGFQLLVDARNQPAVQRLRERKHREEKPFAVMFPTLQATQAVCELSALEERLLTSPESPIVLLRQARIFNPQLAPGNPNLGVMLPYTPLHHLLLRALDFPVVATSGNLSDEPICLEEEEALRRLRGIADLFLVHNRPIVRQMDDSIVRVLADRELVLRRARGFAPLPVPLAHAGPPMLALGAHLKNAIALGLDDQAFVSQHIGDLATPQAYKAFTEISRDLPRLYEAEPEIVVCDLHPDYLSTRFAQQLGRPVEQVQHHYAHILSCMAENEIAPPVLGIAWDGTGYGQDGTVWGGEFLLVRPGGFERVAHLRCFRLPGGEAAVREPRRCALGVLQEIFGQELWSRADLTGEFTVAERAILPAVFARELNAPRTSSAGRLFDAAASLMGLRQRATFEGQAAMELEFAAAAEESAAYPFPVRAGAPLLIDWEGAICAIMEDCRRETSVATMAAKFHNGLVAAIVDVARRVGQRRVALSGGCFQNRYLTERVIAALQAADFQPCWHQRVPPNDGGIALGQMAAAARSRA